MSYWKEVKNQWRQMTEQYDPPPKKGTGDGGTGAPGKEWEQVYKKFRQVHGREPYSYQELQDWWAL